MLHKCSESLGGLQFSENPKGLTNYRLFHTSFSICVYAVAHKSTARLKGYAIVLSSSQVNILITECRGRGAVFPRKTAQTQCHHLSQKGTLACWSICWAPPCVMRFLKKTAKKNGAFTPHVFFLSASLNCNVPFNKSTKAFARFAEAVNMQLAMFGQPDCDWLRCWATTPSVLSVGPASLG